MSNLSVQLLLTGDELLNGDIVDTNSAFIAATLKDVGIAVARKVTASDNMNQLVSELNAMSEQADIVIVNGGLGPTSDDYTSQALATLTSCPLELNLDAKKHLETWAMRRNAVLSDANMKQAYLPKGCEIIDNPIGSAVGFCMTFKECKIICTPGVPNELYAMLGSIITQFIQPLVPNYQCYITERLVVFGIGESQLQTLVSEYFSSWPNELTLGFRAQSPFVEVKISTKEKNNEALLHTYTSKLHQLIGEHVLNIEKIHDFCLAEHTYQLLKAHNKTITMAESCTGGLIAHMFTSIPGASSTFNGSFVTYSNAMKTKMINVSEHTLKNFGAVSKDVALEMARGALKQVGADYVIAVTGIAGPDGGSAEKPVGSVWIAWGSAEQLNCHYFLIKGSRHYFQKAVANRAFDLIRRQISNCDAPPRYIQGDS
ncbi:CinA family nicotinamide mononucleotide deamidase-related protein [Thalassotalea ganghwensis]